MRKTLIEKAEIEEKLKESEYTRANYRRDFESSQHELTLLRNSVVQQATFENHFYGATLTDACLGTKLFCLSVG